jgi:hypothetical protein
MKDLVFKVNAREVFDPLYSANAPLGHLDAYGPVRIEDHRNVPAGTRMVLCDTTVGLARWSIVLGPASFEDREDQEADGLAWKTKPKTGWYLPFVAVTDWLTLHFPDDIRSYIRDTSAGTGGQHTTRFLPTSMGNRLWAAAFTEQKAVLTREGGGSFTEGFDNRFALQEDGEPILV